MKQPNSNENPWKIVVLLGAVGIDLVVCMIAGYLAGSYLNRIAGGDTMYAAYGAIIGLGLGIVTVILIVKRYLGGLK